MDVNDSRVYDLRNREINSNIPLLVFVFIILILGMVGNAFSIAFYSMSKRMTVANFLIVALAVNDLVANIVFWDEIPVMFQAFTFRNTVACKTVFFLNNLVMVNSVLLLVVIAIDRFKRICYPFSRQMSLKVAKITVITVTIVTFCLTLREPLLAEIVTKPVQMNDNTTVYGYFCAHTDDQKYYTIIKVSHTFNTALFALSIIAMIVLYTLVAKRIVQTRSAVTGTIKKEESSSESANTILSNISSDSESARNASLIKDPRLTNQASENNGSSDCKATANEAKDGVKTNSDARKESRKSKALSVKKCELRMESSGRYNQAERTVTKMTITFTAASILSFIPYFAVMLFTKRHISTEDNLSNMGKKVARQFYMLNCVVNPYIMCFFNQKLRRFVINCVKKRKCQRLE